MTAAGAPAPGAGRRRFVAPPRSAVRASVFEHPLYRALGGFGDLLVRPDWPGVAALNDRLAVQAKTFVEQDDALLADGLHYEARIALRGQIATRACSWHDLFNALVWARYPAIKQALNARQCEDLATLGPAVRSRAQAALTQFDESGVIVRVRDPALLAAWDAHAWPQWFAPAAWADGGTAVAAVVGHALLEQGLAPGRLLVGKCLVVVGEDDDAAVATVARAIAEGRALRDPLALRPLPLAGIPGWQHGRVDFATQRDYYRPLRAGRTYPPPVA